MTDTSKKILDQLKRKELLQQFGIEPTAFLRRTGTRQLPQGTRPGPGTHMLSWRNERRDEQNLYNEVTIDLLVAHILELEAQLAIEAEVIRERTLANYVDNTSLDGFTPVGPA
ncbi:hypothetical protein [Paraburkholderia sp. BCC1886]|uniref:hypothetical protein n=1 Tax=Paraburkholderia sp. BCC1886 TaxID=2562670 RepID=UPI001183BA5C|nr:hypothetical protein [Paraburkholderia sp. BCC1886]